MATTAQTPAALPRAVRFMAWARAVRWAGWGFGDGLLPLFIFFAADTFAEAGLFKAMFEIVSILSLPIIGSYEDRISARHLIIIALIAYPFVGISYFLAGTLGAAVFIVIARAIHGFAATVEYLSVNTYFRRFAKRAELGTAFGYIDSCSNFGWIITALIGMGLAPIVPIHWLLAAVVPFSLVALVLVLHAPVDKPRVRVPALTSFLRSYKNAFDEWRTWGRRLWFFTALMFFVTLLDDLMLFFIPIDAYIEGAQPTLVILLMVVAALPSLFGIRLGRLVDRYGPLPVVAGSLVGVAIVMGSIAIFPLYGVKVAASFVLGILFECFIIVQRREIVTLGPAATSGQRGGAFESIMTLGNLSAPVLLGTALDTVGFESVLGIVACIALFLSFTYIVTQRRFRFVTS